MCLSCLVRHWSRRLLTADNVIQRKKRARLLARLITSRLVSKPRGRKISSNVSRISCLSSAETSLHCETITSSVCTTSFTDDSSSSASATTTTETSHKHTDYLLPVNHSSPAAPSLFTLWEPIKTFHMFFTTFTMPTPCSLLKTILVFSTCLQKEYIGALKSQCTIMRNLPQ